MNIEEVIIEYKKLAKKYDDLKHILLTFNESLGYSLESVQNEYKIITAACDELMDRLNESDLVVWRDNEPELKQ